MTAESSTTALVDLLAQVLARHTPPGEGHVVLSGADYEERLRKALASRLQPGEELEVALRRIRNQLAHSSLQLAQPQDLDPTVLFESKHLPSLREKLTGQWFETVDSSARRCVFLIFAGLSSNAQTIASTSDDELIEHALELAHDKEEITEAAVSVTEAFVERLAGVGDLLGKLDPMEAKRLGDVAADQVIASSRWSQFVGDRLNTTQVADLLGVSRQALAKRQASGSLLGLPGHGTTWYPAWQFDMEQHEIRSEVRDIIGAFRDQLGEVDPLVVASWASTPQPEDLDGLTPSQWLATRGDVDQLRRASARAAARLAR